MSRSQSTATCIDTLTPADLKMFEDFGIPPELLEEAGVVRVSDAEARTVWGMLAPAHRPLQGMVFPYFSLDTGRRTGARLRRDNPEIENGKEKDKYISSYADRKTLFTSPGAAERLRDPETVIILVEAEKSALALEALARRYGLKLVAEGMGGCWGWRSGRIAKTENARGVRVDVAGPIPDLDILNGRKVIVALDSNVAHNKKVRDAQSALVRELKSRGCEVHVLKLPGDGGVNGPDDYIKTHGDHAMLKLVKDSYETAAYYDYGGGRFEVDDKGNTFTPPPDKEDTRNLRSGCALGSTSSPRRATQNRASGAACSNGRTTTASCINGQCRWSCCSATAASKRAASWRVRAWLSRRRKQRRNISRRSCKRGPPKSARAVLISRDGQKRQTEPYM